MHRALRYLASVAALALPVTTQQSPTPADPHERPLRPCVLSTLRPESTYTGRAWNDGVVPYSFDNVSQANQLLMLAAMHELEAVSPVTFVQHSRQPDWVRIRDAGANGQNGSDAIGRAGGMQTITIFNWNSPMRMAHELCHVLGFWHEHQRPDRDNYVRIDTANIDPVIYINNFTLAPAATPWGSYGFDSIMHYGQFDLALNPSLPTITVLPPNQSLQGTIGQRLYLSQGDILGLQSAYGHLPIAMASLHSTLTQGNSGSYTYHSAVSADGRFVVFESLASNLIPGDLNASADVFVHDLQNNETSLVSASSGGVQGNSRSRAPAISADGRYVAFQSLATNLVPGDTNGDYDVFVRYLGSPMATIRVSVNSGGQQTDNGSSDSASISADGHLVAFASYATNLAPNDTNQRKDIFVRDLLAGLTARVSVGPGGSQLPGNSGTPSISGDGRVVAFMYQDPVNTGPDVWVHEIQTGRVRALTSGGTSSGAPSLSADGRFVAFSSGASNLVPGDTNGYQDVFVYDMSTGQMTRVSVDSVGGQADGDSLEPAISGDGRFVTFGSLADNLTIDDNNDSADVFVHDRQTGMTTRVSLDARGREGNSDSGLASISGDGRFVVFTSDADNLVAVDGNDVPDVFVHDRRNGLAAGAVAFGSPCPGSHGSPQIHVLAWPTVGNATFDIRVDNAMATSTVLLGVSTDTLSVGLGPCTLYLQSFDLLLVGPSSAAGRATFPLPIPGDPMLRGLPLYAQGFVVDPGGAFQSLLAFTGGLRLLIGD